MRALVAAVAALATAVPCAAQIEAPPPWPEPPHQLLIVGTFHFSDAGLDSYRPQFDVDVMSPERQAEVEALVERLAAFRPTRVAVEVMPEYQSRIDSLYSAYRAGDLELGSNEVHQLGFRLAAAAGHEDVHAVDARRRFYEPWVEPDSFALANGQIGMFDPEWETAYRAMHEWEDRAKVGRTLQETLLRLNDRHRALRSHGQYLMGNFEVGDDQAYPGVDSKTAWFNRNLRIFANLQRLLRTDAERIVLVIGAGHVALLRHAAEASPQFRFVELSEVLGPGG